MIHTACRLTLEQKPSLIEQIQNPNFRKKKKRLAVHIIFAGFLSIKTFAFREKKNWHHSLKGLLLKARIKYNSHILKICL